MGSPLTSKPSCLDPIKMPFPSALLLFRSASCPLLLLHLCTGKLKSRLAHSNEERRRNKWGDGRICGIIMMFKGNVAFLRWKCDQRWLGRGSLKQFTLFIYCIYMPLFYFKATLFWKGGSQIKCKDNAIRNSLKTIKHWTTVFKLYNQNIFP